MRSSSIGNSWRLLPAHRIRGAWVGVLILDGVAYTSRFAVTNFGSYDVWDERDGMMKTTPKEFAGQAPRASDGSLNVYYLI
jgi:hypothetical protein